ncbi:MAG: hypothetical protein JWM68_42 [Verrucomicrobiales bacterium]|nr:hypothetical protein [Verrucomicrobiales bacterium]
MSSNSVTPEVVRQFSSLPLHDAILQELRLDWKHRTCTASILAFMDRTKDAVARQILWHDVSEAFIPHQNPWGPSVFINSASVDLDGIFTIEMQSGDQIQIQAKGFDFK